MSLPAGTRIGHYEVVELAGAGGMGEVYRARDTQLKRDVALKVLPASLTRDPGRLARFQREAEILASLNNPAIATIHGFVHDGPAHAIVMEFVEGDTLAERIKQGPLPIPTVEAYARQIIAALEYAHEHGVTHRDLKPANIKVTPEGTIKLLDFGLAKAVEDPSPQASTTDSPTLTIGHTQAGVILGTAAYMSPEQAVGKPADRRADIFSFGVVLYEILTGQRAFTGDSAPEILASVVKEQPDWSKLPRDTPPAMRAILERCLVKDRKQRMQAIGEARIALDTPLDGPQRAEARPTWQWIVAGALAVAGGVIGWFLHRPPAPAPRQVAHFTMTLPKGSSVLALSRDGSRIVFRGPAVGKTGAPALYVRALDDPDTRLIPGTQGFSFTTFSPRDDWMAITGKGGQLMKIPSSGGVSVPLIEGIQAATPSWGGDDGILITSAAGILRIPAGGGKPETVAPADAAKDEQYLYPEWLPGGRYILATAVTSPAGQTIRTIAIDTTTGNKHVLLDNVVAGSFAPTGLSPGIGHLVYADNGTLFAAPFNANTLRIEPAVPVLQGVGITTDSETAFSFSDSGTLVYRPRGRGFSDFATPMSSLHWVDRKGAEQPLPFPAAPYGNNGMRLSPDGGRVAIVVQESATDYNFWVYELARPARAKITFGDFNYTPLWTPDGSRVIYLHTDPNQGNPSIVSVAPDGGDPRTLWQGPYRPYSMSGDRIVIAGTPPNADSAAGSEAPKGSNLKGKGKGGRGSQLRLLKLGPDGKAAPGEPEPFLDARFGRQFAEFSPDSKWVAFQSNQTGQSEIYVVSYPVPGNVIPISNGGGTLPRWNPNGRELFYRNGDKMMAVDVVLGAAFRAGTPRVLFEKAFESYDVHPNGQRFLMIRPEPEEVSDQATEYHVILNWFEELRRPAPLSK